MVRPSARRDLPPPAVPIRRKSGLEVKQSSTPASVERPLTAAADAQLASGERL